MATTPTAAPPRLDPRDVLGLDHLLGDEERMLRDTVRRWVGDRVLGEIEEWFNSGALRGRELDGLRGGVPRARGGRLGRAQPRLRAGVARDVPDLEARLRGAEGDL